MQGTKLLTMLTALAVVLPACNGGGGSGDAGSADGTDDADTGSSGSTTASTTMTGDGTADTGPRLDVGTKLDVGFETDSDTDGPIDVCKVNEDGDGMLPCDDEAPPNSFEPVLQWSWWIDEQDQSGDSVSLPLVANLTDDNDDGEIDLCDTPDVVVVAGPNQAGPGNVYVLDGATGLEHWHSTELAVNQISPALGDIDGDGLSEILVVESGPQFMNSIPAAVILAYEHDGTLKWTSDPHPAGTGDAIALADLDNDGDIEVISSSSLFDHQGTLLWTKDAERSVYVVPAATAADLDGDMDLEVVFGRVAYHHDGSPLYENLSLEPGFPQVANLDGDPEPEVLIVEAGGLTMLEHDGTVKYEGLTPTGVPPSGQFGGWFRPAAVHNLDADPASEFVVSSLDVYAAYDGDATVLWQAPVLDSSGRASGTAFDFLGDATAEAVYGDETTLFAFDEVGMEVFSVQRSSPTWIEYPTVADVDNDQSAEILVVSSFYLGVPFQSPTLQVFGDSDDRWIPARRIWNQHTYHVTNVREDGTIPQFEKPHWELLNTFRTQAQINPGGGGIVCKPEG